ncbi:MAG: hypothetical protein KAH32_03845 [Chlamydiia bacterium]|nr:hypothetical protein [Chlamydiia bacterium]
MAERRFLVDVNVEGWVKSSISIAELIDPKYLVTLEYLESILDSVSSITWASLVALPGKKAGDRYNIITAAPSGVIYGEVSLSTSKTFIYWDGVFEQSIIIR